MTTAQVRIYFQAASNLKLAFAIFSAAALLSLASVLLFDGLVPAVLIALGGIVLAGLVLKSSSDGVGEKMLDALIEKHLDRLKKRALNKAEIEADDTKREPVVIVSPRVFNRGGAELHFRKGADGMVRFTPLHVTVIHFTEHQLVLYRCALDLLTGNPLNEQVVEYFYKHVVAVTVETTSLTFKKSELGDDLIRRFPALKDALEDNTIQLDHAQVFTLKTAAGGVQVVLRDASLAKRLGVDTDFHLDYTHKAVQAVRTFIRGKQAT